MPPEKAAKMTKKNEKKGKKAVEKCQKYKISNKIGLIVISLSLPLAYKQLVGYKQIKDNKSQIWAQKHNHIKRTIEMNDGNL